MATWQILFLIKIYRNFTKMSLKTDIQSYGQDPEAYNAMDCSQLITKLTDAI